MKYPRQILICDDDAVFQLGVKHSLKGMFEFRSAYNGDEALAVLKKYPVDVLLLDIQMRNPLEGIELIPKLLEVDPDLAIVMSSALTDFRTVREAMKLGAVDYISKEMSPEELTLTLNQVFERKELLQRQNQQNFETLTVHKQHILVGVSRSIQHLKYVIDKVRNSSANVVITGETGTGKELVARQLRHSLQNGILAPFLAVDSSTIQQSTAESVLFGHEKGAFTGADKLTRGLFEEANQGIVYFDEISNMPLNIQSKLLRVLQEKEISRLGSSRVIKLDFRVICATNKNLEEAVAKGEFKEDLLHRLNVIPIHVPPLRDRVEDIPYLVEHFVQKHQTRPLHFEPETLKILSKYPWPGNVRELASLVAYTTTMTEESTVTPDDLPIKFQNILRPNSDKMANEGLFYQKISQFEKILLKDEYNKFQGNISQLASVLGMDRSHLYSKLKEYEIHSSRAKSGSPQSSESKKSAQVIP